MQFNFFEIKDMSPSEQAVRLLEKQIIKCEELEKEAELTKSSCFEEWKTTTDIILLRFFGKESKEYKDLAHLDYWPNVILRKDDPRKMSLYQEAYIGGL